jgi:tetratricopeptide (TPR) repeat protein
MSVDVQPLWDFSDPAGSEARFREALATATGDDALVLRTQIARTYGLRRRFEEARAELAAVAASLDGAGPEPRVRYELERGRGLISAVTTPDERTPEALAAARDAYTRAFETARDAGLDGLAIDAIHMMAFVDDAPADQLAWNDRGLALVAASTQPAAVRWEASLRNNRGMALHGLGRDEEALGEFQRALELQEAQGEPGGVAVAWWMVAWTLRLLGRRDEALDIQLRLERELDAAGTPDEYVFEELEALYREAGDLEQAAHYAARLAEIRPAGGGAA